MAGPRYRNYFPDSRKHSAFNKAKYLLYIPYLKAKGFLSLRNVKTDGNCENTNFTETVTRESPVREQDNNANLEHPIW